MEGDIKQYISEDGDISRILYFNYSSQNGVYFNFHWAIFVNMACRQDIRLDWTPSLQQKGFFVARLFLSRFSICMELQPAVLSYKVRP